VEVKVSIFKPSGESEPQVGENRDGFEIEFGGGRKSFGARHVLNGLGVKLPTGKHVLVRVWLTHVADQTPSELFVPQFLRERPAGPSGWAECR
jgi:hypothetical protein